MNIQNILLVDDDASIRMIAEISLSRVGHWNVIQAESGVKALDILEKMEPGQPDLILLDVMMPGTDGLTMFRLLRENPKTAQIPVIFMTAKVQKQEVLSYYQLGASGVIIKPFDPLALPKEIENILGKGVSSTCPK